MLCDDSGSVSIPTLLPAPFILITCPAVFLRRADCYPITFILHNVNPLWPGNLNRLWCGFDAMHTVWPHCFCAVAPGAPASPRAGSRHDLWGNLTLKRMQMRRRINIQRRSLVDLSRCKAISIGDINIQQQRAGTQNNTVSKTTTQRVKQKENKSILMEDHNNTHRAAAAAAAAADAGLTVTLFLTGYTCNQSQWLAAHSLASSCV